MMKHRSALLRCAARNINLKKLLAASKLRSVALQQQSRFGPSRNPAPGSSDRAGLVPLGRYP